ncbi:MAG: cytochrome b, partial [Pseudomonadota bacterium]
ARVLHWLMAVMILMALMGGFYMINVETDLVAQFQSIQMHKSFGFVIFTLAVLRILWRFTQPASPTLPDTMPAWQRMASHASHYVLYGLMLWMPLSGWLMSSASPLNNEGAYPVQVKNMVFGLFEMPDPFPNGTEALMQPFLIAHNVGAMALAALLLVHVGAALKHHFVDRDSVLRRMVRG